MKRLLLICTLLLSSSLFANTASVEIELSQNKEVDYLYYNFGIQTVGSYRTAYYKITNTGDIDLSFKNAIIYGAGYHARHNCSAGLPRLARCSFTVEFTPYFEGLYPGQFVMNFEQDYAVVVNLSGQATR